MAKIRVEDLSRSMGLETQDLVFKLKSIGVRVEGDEALIDTNIIQAILQGKRLPQPREVILRDDAEPPAAPAHSQRAPLRRTAPGRPRRSMIQRVERPIREIEVKHKVGEGAVGPEGDTAGPEVPGVSDAVPAESADAAALEARPEVPVAEVTEPAKAQDATVTETESSAKKPSRPAKAAAEALSPPAEAEKARAEAAKPEKVAVKKPKAEKTKAAKPAAKKPAAKKPAAAPAPPPPARQERPSAAAAKGAARKPSAAPSSQPKGPAGPRRGRSQPVPSRPAPAGRRGVRRPGMRPPERPPMRPAAQEEKRLPVSARGHRRAQRRKEEPAKSSAVLQFKEAKPSGPVTIAEGMTVREFAEKLDVKAKDLIRTLVMRGVMANINHVLDSETARSLAEELGVEVMEISFEEEVQLQHESTFEGDELEKEDRPPVVTVMGHVDHGKTTLLDRIRSANVAEGEAGGITQHIGAYHVDVGEKQIVFLDTPGHEAFTMMRARGAQVTDIVVLVVAADDSVMPQTIEAINHAKAAGVPIVVAINKIDKSNANLDRVRKELADQGLTVEAWGGDVVSVALSALKGEGVDDLLEMILLTADLLELKAAPGIPANGAVLEARKETGRGTVATVLVQNGTLRVGDTFVAGSTWGKVRIMTDDRGDRLKEAGPATPVEVTGFTDVPGAGDLFQVMENEAKARSIAELRRDEERQRDLRPLPKRVSLEQLFSQNQEETKELSIIIKADVDGSVEVLRETLGKLSTEKVKINILHAAVGAINNSDVLIASASDAIIIGFNVRPEKSAVALAEKEEVDIRLHTVIYELSDELKSAMAGLLEPTFKEVHTGTAEVRNTFKIPKVGVVAGAHIVDGFIPRSATVRLLRDNRVVWEGRIASLRRFKEDVSEVRSGFDCGIGLERFQDVKPGDSIEAFTREEVAPVL